MVQNSFIGTKYEATILKSKLLKQFCNFEIQKI